MENPFADRLKALNFRNPNRMLLEEQCGYFAALLLEVPHEAIEVASQTSKSTVSLLADAGHVRGGQIRYPKVARELAKLGQEAFIEKYLTPVIRERVAEAIETVAHRKRNALNAKGYDPRASRYVGRHEWPQTSLDMHVIFQIHLAPDRGGYFWRNLRPSQLDPEVPAAQVNIHPGCVPRGDPKRDNGNLGFASSEACYRHVHRLLNPTDAQQAEDNPS